VQEVTLAHAVAAITSFNGKYQSIQPYKIFQFLVTLMFFSVLLCIVNLNNFMVVVFVIPYARN
jgi:hypothetical protein